MANEADILIQIKADASGAVAAVKDLETKVSKSMEESAGAVSSLSRRLAEMEGKAATGAAKVSTLADKAGQAGNAFAKLRGGLSLVSPELGELAGIGNDAADALEVAAGRGAGFAGRLVALTPLLATAVAGFISLYKVVDTYAESKREAIRVNAQFAETMKPLDEALETARAEQALLTQAQAAGKDELKEFLAIADLHAAAETKVAEATAKSREEREALTKRLAEYTNQNSFDARITKDRIAAIDAELEQAREKGNELKRLTTGSHALREALEAQAGAETKVGEVAAAVAEREISFQEQVDELRQRVAEREADRQRALREEHNANLIEQEAIFKKMDEERARAAEELADKQIEEARRAADEAADAYREATQAALASVNQVGGYITGALGMVAGAHEDSYQIAADAVSRLETQLAASEEYLTNAQKKALEKRIEAQKDAAEQQFEAAKRAKVAEALASTALAAINAIAQSPPPSPFGLIGAGVATAAGVAAVANIESQQFTAYRGGFPDEVPATLHRNEAVVSQQGRAALGDAAIARANAGMSSAPQRVEVLFQYRHRQFDPAVADTVHRGGRLNREISTRTRTGTGAHRTR